MLRRSTTSIHNNHSRTKHVILRSKRNVPQYTDPCALLQDVNEPNMGGEETRYGDFSVLNHTNHPGVVYYFIELRDPNGNPIPANNNNNQSSNNNSRHDI